MKLAITDANIFIDLFQIELIHELFELDIELYSTIEVIFELKEEHQEIVLAIPELTILSTADLGYLEDQGFTLSGRLSPADLSVFYHARNLKAGILTGDSLLRKIAEKQGFEVHGTLWVLDKMVENQRLPEKDAIDNLNVLRDFNKRLPKEECEKMVKKWTK